MRRGLVESCRSQWEVSAEARLQNICSVPITLVLRVQEEKGASAVNEIERERESGLPWRSRRFEKRDEGEFTSDGEHAECDAGCRVQCGETQPRFPLSLGK